MLHMIVTYSVLPGMREAYIRDSQELINKTNQEEGCLFYELCEIIEDDSQTDSTLTFVEAWKDQAALDYHFETEHFKQVSAILTSYRVPDSRIRTKYITVASACTGM